MDSTSQAQNPNEIHTQPPMTSPLPMRTDGPAKGTAGVHPSAIGSESQGSYGGRSDQNIEGKESKSLDTTASTDNQSLNQNRGETQARNPSKDFNSNDTNYSEQDGEENNDKPSTEPEGGYPPQLHAGKLDGVGPEYGAANKITLGERFQGIKEQVKGVIKKDPELKQKGHDRMTGELKRREKEQEDNANPFASAGEDPIKSNQNDNNNTAQSDSQPEPQSQPSQQSQTSGINSEHAATDQIRAQDATQREAGTDAVPKAHPNDSQAYEQAKTISGNEIGQGQEPIGKQNVEAGVATDRQRMSQSNGQPISV